MKTPASTLLLSALFALAGGLPSGIGAEAAPVAIENEATVSAPAAPSTESAPAEPSQPPLRRLDVETPEPTAENAGEPDLEDVSTIERVEREADEATRERLRHRNRGGHHGDAHVLFWGNSNLAENESAEAVVSIIGSSTAAGYVSEAVVSILGSSTSTGEVHGEVISILGSSRATSGSVGGEVISVLGNTYVNVPVRGEVIAVMGNVELGPDAVVHGEIVCVGGSIKRHPQSVVHGEIRHFGLGGDFSAFDGLHAWIEQCLMKARLLAFGPNLMWAWWIAIGFLLFYLFVAALLPRPIESCLRTLDQHPGYSLLTALLVTLITPLAAILLLFTVIGTPALGIVQFVASIFGKLVMIAWMGRLVTRWAGNSGPLAHPVAAVLVGGIILLGLYTVPVIAFLVGAFLSWLGVGVVIYTIVLNLRRNRDLPPRVVAAPVVASVATASAAGMGATSAPIPPMVPHAPVAAGVTSAGFTGATTATPPVPPVASATPTPPLTAAPAPILVSAATLHRAGFWIRIAASALDTLLVAVSVNLLPDHFQPNFLLAFAAYCVVLWALKGTTIGGIVCSLKVVRLNDQPVDWPTALVRALGGFLSLFAAGIGFIWVQFDDQRQSWHDKIAGTTIVHVPRGVSLV